MFFFRFLGSTKNVFFLRQAKTVFHFPTLGKARPSPTKINCSLSAAVRGRTLHMSFTSEIKSVPPPGDAP